MTDPSRNRDPTPVEVIGFEIRLIRDHVAPLLALLIIKVRRKGIIDGLNLVLQPVQGIDHAHGLPTAFLQAAPPRREIVSRICSINRRINKFPLKYSRNYGMSSFLKYPRSDIFPPNLHPPISTVLRNQLLKLFFQLWNPYLSGL